MRLVTRNDSCKLLQTLPSPPRRAARECERNQSSGMLPQGNNAGKRGDVLEKKLRKKQEKTLTVQRNTKVNKQTLQEGRGKQRRGFCLLYGKLQEQIQQHFHEIQLLLKPTFLMTAQARF